MATLRVRFETGAPEQAIRAPLSGAPFQHDGLPGSLLDLMLGHGIFLEHACGGNCACTTCHVIVQRGAAALSPATEAEEDLLDKAVGLTSTSRLACQAVIARDDAEIEIVVPRFTVNQAPTHGG